MDLSAFIFVALAVAWAVYLVPKALKHHDDVVRSRSVDRFSHTMRVLARREPINRRNARLVVTPGRPARTAVVVTKGAEPVAAPVAEQPPVPVQVRREAANRAARRRRNVLATILFADVVVLSLAAFSVVGWAYAAIPGALLVAWLVACRLMVKKERAVSAPASRMPIQVEPQEPAAAPEDVDASADTSTTAAALAPAVVRSTDPQLWDPVPVTLPTYVTKPAATRRTVRTINLDDTGVWTSGRSESDSQIARDAEQAERADKAARKQADDDRAVGS
ncbi:MAG: hypothetical protein JWN22_2177 [Nocardioides sp.]|nr:hypothetical protein [Nocardioides sp.]